MDKINGSLFVDFKQAFDTIDHDILIKKLSCYGLSCSTLHLLQSFLSHRVQSVSFNNNISKAKLIRRGVPQGSILGPLLFSIYINDLPDYVSFGNCEIFADDRSIHVSDSKLANVINKLELSGKQLFSWAHINKMVVHPDKTKFTILTTRQKHQRLPPLQNSILINGQSIKRVSSIRFLVHLLQSFLSDRVQSVSFNNNISKATLIRRGVPQGSILGPLLFSIYINDLPDYVSFGNCEIFADDRSIHVSDSKLANVIHKLELSGKQLFSWAHINKMVVHPDKTKFTILTTRQRLPPL
ncbi:RNA-directed DNA polymerase from mobile element jockey-like protein [Plakobranchus ocellatus]|uniref:RNA-directed DNA polymerase from mobile element jockey-like protein n=1 Tax=Plakobranchus ocellatus TaxID=259542 RepID=A0AAV4DU41_9GAST|nr:RNA-directed DNA polymerase from mobile element jockey-like protein [Plakobranchus ocellatus]